MNANFFLLISLVDSLAIHLANISINDKIGSIWGWEFQNDIRFSTSEKRKIFLGNFMILVRWSWAIPKTSWLQAEKVKSSLTLIEYASNLGCDAFSPTETHIYQMVASWKSFLEKKFGGMLYHKDQREMILNLASPFHQFAPKSENSSSIIGFQNVKLLLWGQLLVRSDRISDSVKTGGFASGFSDRWTIPPPERLRALLESCPPILKSL
jgi:hypothetical protein